MFEGPVTGNIPEVLDNGEVTDGTHVTAGQLALALTPYAQVTDLAVNTAASGNNAAAIQSLDDRGRAGGRARKQHRRAAELADHGSLQQGRPVGLRRAGGRGGHEEHPRLSGLSNYSTTAAMNGSIASATVAANYGLKTVVDQHSLDIAARITPLEVDTKVANALLGAVTAAALASELASRDASILRQTPTP